MTTSLILFALLVVAYFIWGRSKKPGGAGRPDLGRTVSFMPTEPLKPSFSAAGWDGYTGMQLALCVELEKGECYPLIQAGSLPPVSVTTTFSTGRSDQSHLSVSLLAGLSARADRSQLVGRLTIGPIPLTGEDIRPVEVRCTVGPDGCVTADAVSEGHAVPCPLSEASLGAIPIGR